MGDLTEDALKSYSGRGESAKVNDRFSGVVGPQADFALLNLSKKNYPEALAEYINESSEQTGAFIYIKKLDTRAGITHMSSGFYLTALQLNFKERVQLMENFNSASAGFFGDAVKIYQLQGIAIDYASTGDLINEYFQQSALIDMYNTQLRGSKLVENNSIAVLKILNHTIEGYPIDMNVSYNSGQDKMAQFSMSWIVTKHELVLDGVLNDTHLKDMYSINASGGNIKTTLSNIDTIIYMCADVLNLRDRTNLPDKFVKEQEFFEFFSSGETLSIIQNLSIKTLITTNKSTVQAYLDKIIALIKLVESKKTDIVSVLPTRESMEFKSIKLDTGSFFQDLDKQNKIVDTLVADIKLIAGLNSDLRNKKTSLVKNKIKEST